MRCYGFAESAGACYSKQTFVLIDIFRQGLNLTGETAAVFRCLRRFYRPASVFALTLS